MKNAKQATLFGEVKPVEKQVRTSKPKKSRGKGTSKPSESGSSQRTEDSSSNGPRSESRGRPESLPSLPPSEDEDGERVASPSATPRTTGSPMPVPLYCEDYLETGQRCGESPVVVMVGVSGSFWHVCAWHELYGTRAEFRRVLRRLDGKPLHPVKESKPVQTPASTTRRKRSSTKSSRKKRKTR